MSDHLHLHRDRDAWKAKAEELEQQIASYSGVLTSKTAALDVWREMARRYEAALREVEAHHAKLNDESGRDQGRSRTLGIVRKALEVVGEVRINRTEKS